MGEPTPVRGGFPPPGAAEAKYLTVTKAFEDRIPVTSYRITARGRKALEGYRAAMLQGLGRGNG